MNWYQSIFLMAVQSILGRQTPTKLETWALKQLGFWSTRPTTVQAGSDHYYHTECPAYVRPKTSKSSDNPCRPGLWAGRVDHWWHTHVFYVLYLFRLCFCCHGRVDHWWPLSFSMLLFWHYRFFNFLSSVANLASKATLLDKNFCWTCKIFCKYFFFWSPWCYQSRNWKCKNAVDVKSISLAEES